MAQFAKVWVDVKLGQPLDYEIPASLQGQVGVGSRVVVPLGAREVSGCVTSMGEHSNVAHVKSIVSVTGDSAYLSPAMMKLAAWMSEYYCAPMAHAVRAALPGSVRGKGVRFKHSLQVRLADAAAGMKRDEAKLTAKQRAALIHLQAQGEEGDSLSGLTRALKISAAPVHALARKGWVRMSDQVMRRDPLVRRETLPTQPKTLMPEQQAALDQIVACVDALEGGPDRQTPGAADGVDGRGPRVTLVHGVTGSGKTEVYLQAIDYVLKKGMGALVLVPEISLTPQTLRRFMARFGKRIAVLHSHLSDGERHDEWHRIHRAEADIVVGARSAVFAPLRRLGLIVVDEEHDTGYKQEESPRYHARDVAVMRGRIEGCAVALGSATPSLESWHNARTGKYRMAVLPRRADNRRMPTVQVVDMRVETQRQGHASVFSRQLLDAVGARLKQGEQTMLFLNRRGYATSLVCPHCGFVARCENCSVSLTYHQTDDRLRCHLCGDSRCAPERCPSCQAPDFKFSGMGTQRVEKIMRKIFPHARIQRMDADMTTRKNSHDRILDAFRSGRLDILIGTQMIAKGLHFPSVTLVGVIYADLSLHMPDFRASERTFQLLAQVAGRAGRGDVYGEVLIQTYTPLNPALQSARRVDYDGFSEQELAFRKELNYPPYSRLICIHLRGVSESLVSYCANVLAKRIQDHPGRSDQVTVSDPSPAPIAKVKGKHRFQIMLRARSVRLMTRILNEALRDFKPPREVEVAVDVDAISLL